MKIAVTASTILNKESQIPDIQKFEISCDYSSLIKDGRKSGSYIVTFKAVISGYQYSSMNVIDNDIETSLGYETSGEYEYKLVVNYNTAIAHKIIFKTDSNLEREINITVIDDTKKVFYLGKIDETPSPESYGFDYFVDGDYYLNENGDIFVYKADESGEFDFLLNENPSSEQLANALKDAVSLGNTSGSVVTWMRILAVNRAFIEELKVTDANIENVKLQTIEIPTVDGTPAWEWDVDGIRAIGADGKKWEFRRDGSVYLNSVQIEGALIANDINSLGILKTQHQTPATTRTATIPLDCWSTKKLFNRLPQSDYTNGFRDCSDNLITYNGISYDKYTVRRINNLTDDCFSLAQWSRRYGNNSGSHTLFEGTVSQLAQCLNIGYDTKYEPTVEVTRAKTITDMDNPVYVWISKTDNTRLWASVWVNGVMIQKGTQFNFVFSEYLLPTDTVKIDVENAHLLNDMTCHISCSVVLEDNAIMTDMLNSTIIGRTQRYTASATSTSRTVTVFTFNTNNNIRKVVFKGEIKNGVYLQTQDGTRVSLNIGEVYNLELNSTYSIILTTTTGKDSEGDTVYYYGSVKNFFGTFADGSSQGNIVLFNDTDEEYEIIQSYEETNYLCWNNKSLDTNLINLSTLVPLERVNQLSVYNLLSSYGYRQGFDYEVDTNSTFTINDNTYDITRVGIGVNYFRLFVNNEWIYFYNTAEVKEEAFYTNCSFSFTPLALRDSVLTTSLEPFEDIESSIGSQLKRYLDAYIRDIFATKIESETLSSNTIECDEITSDSFKQMYDYTETEITPVSSYIQSLKCSTIHIVNNIYALCINALYVYSSNHSHVEETITYPRPFSKIIGTYTGNREWNGTPNYGRSFGFSEVTTTTATIYNMDTTYNHENDYWVIGEIEE